MNLIHCHPAFSVGKQASIPTSLGIGLELQSVAVGQRKFFWQADGDFIQLLERHTPDAMVGLNQ